MKMYNLTVYAVQTLNVPYTYLSRTTTTAKNMQIIIHEVKIITYCEIKLEQ